MIVKSDSIVNLATSLCAFQNNIGKISKDSKNPFFKSKYASLSNILDAINQPLQDAGLILTQHPDEDKLTTILIDKNSGEYIQSSYSMPVAKQNDPQALGSSITYARRYAIGSILVLNIDDDDDGNMASVKVKESTKKTFPVKSNEELEASALTLKDHHKELLQKASSNLELQLRFGAAWKELGEMCKLNNKYAFSARDELKELYNKRKVELPEPKTGEATL